MAALQTIGRRMAFALYRKLSMPIRNRYRQFADYCRDETDATFFDIHDVRKFNRSLAGWGVAPLALDRAAAERNVAGAARFVVSLLATYPAIHRRFPQALSNGVDGEFAKWLCGSGSRRFGLSAIAVGHIREAFEADLGARVRRVFELREDLRSVWPLALTPKQRGEFLGWLMSYGKKDFQLNEESVLWYAFETDEDRACGLSASFRLHPEWQAAVPHGLTRFGWDELKAWVGKRYGFDCRWLKRATYNPVCGPWDELRAWQIAKPNVVGELPQNADAVAAWLAARPAVHTLGAHGITTLQREIREGVPTQLGVNIIGLFRYTSGLQQAVRSTVESLNRCGVRTTLRDFPVLFLREPRNKTAFDGLENFDVTILNTGIDVPVAEAYRKCGLHSRAGVHRIGIWWWELETLPAAWHDRGDGVDEIWAPTEFIAQAMRTAFRKPVYPMLPGVSLSPFVPLPKSAFGLDPAKTTFTFVFDMNSRMQRKNPLGLIRAFRKAFRTDEAVELAIKVSPPETYYKEQWQELREAVDAAGVTLIDRVLSRSELLALLNASDSYVSLHRSEGFGLTCAEAMLLGKPVIATAYSGNLDFMTPENSLLVPYQRMTLQEDIDPYPRGAVWADPDLDRAAEYMRFIHDNPVQAKALGERAKREVEATLSPIAAGKRMVTRLEQIRRERGQSAT